MTLTVSIRCKLFLSIIFILISRLAGIGWKTSPVLYATALQTARVDLVPLRNIKQIATGSGYNCVLTTTGGVLCWGYNGDGRLGDGTTIDKSTPVAVNGLSSGVAAISVGGAHTCALTTAGGVFCWGYNFWGQLGDGTTVDKHTPIAVSGLDNGVSAISVGGGHTCALTTAGAVLCWGNNPRGQLGDGTTVSKNKPVAVNGLSSGVIAISAGGTHTCALTAASGILCWGSNSDGQLGDGTAIDKNKPVAVNGLGNSVTAISAGDAHSCALTAVGGIICWGNNNDGQLGDGTIVDKKTPVAVSGLGNNAVAISASKYSYTCALTTGGNVLCWGGNSKGQLGDGTTVRKNTPVAVTGLSSGIAAVSTGSFHTCVLTTSGDALCWGSNDFGQLGDNTTGDKKTPVVINGLSSGVAAISAHERHVCALTTGGSVFCWGRNDYGQLGDGTTTSRDIPVAVIGLPSGVAAISGGDYHTCALTATGAALCWGRNDEGQLGDGTFADKNTPVGVSGLGSGVAAISAGGHYHTCALTTVGGVLCWGYNGDGQLGDGTTTRKNTPVAVSGLANGVAAVSAGGSHTCALTKAGTAFCWGWNDYGQLGDGTYVSTNKPVAISGLGNSVTAISASNGYHTCALTTAGAALCWGGNSDGQLGDGTGESKNTPTAVSGLSSGVAAISASGHWHTCALTTTSGILCWGDNSSGQLGDGTTDSKNTPVAVSGLNNGMAAVSTGSFHTCGLTTSGTALCWGSNYDGQLGDGSAWRTIPGAVMIDAAIAPPAVTPTPTTTATSTPTATPTATTTPTITPTPVTARIEGVVIDTATQKGIPNVVMSLKSANIASEITASQVSNARQYSATTDLNGAYVFPAVELGTYTLTGSGAGVRIAAPTPLAITTGGTVQVTPLQASKVQFVLHLPVIRK